MHINLKVMAVTQRRMIVRVTVRFRSLPPFMGMLMVSVVDVKMGVIQSGVRMGKSAFIPGWPNDNRHNHRHKGQSGQETKSHRQAICRA